MSDSNPIGTTVVQNWMVQLAVWSIGVLGLGAIGTIVSVVNWCFWMQHDLGELRRNDGAQDVKIVDHNSAFNSIRAELADLNRKMDRLMP